MSAIALEALPKEIIAQIASFADPSSIISLGATSRVLRSASYESFVFKDVLATSQVHNWQQDSLDLDAIAHQSGTDASIWARYAVADERAWRFAETQSALESPLDLVNFVPELFVVKHPFMSHICWSRVTRQPLDPKPAQTFCLLMAILASNDEMIDVAEVLALQRRRLPVPEPDIRSFMWSLCTIILLFRRARRPQVQDLDIPTVSQIPFRPLNGEYRLPLPFRRSAIELQGPATSAFGGWDSWFNLHTCAAINTADFLTEGTWCGYYSYSNQPHRDAFDEPMLDIKFAPAMALEPRSAQQDISPDPDSVTTCLKAEGCKESVRRFHIHAKVVQSSSNEVTFRARKIYDVGSNLFWDWDCRVTPFGIVGFWGRSQVPLTALAGQSGLLWLWKTDWIKP